MFAKTKKAPGNRITNFLRVTGLGLIMKSLTHDKWKQNISHSWYDKCWIVSASGETMFRTSSVMLTHVANLFLQQLR